MNTFSDPAPSNPFGIALLAGRLVGTILGSDGHITVRAWAKAKNENGRWVTTKFEDAYLVDLAVPGADGDWADKIGTWYPPHSSSKWAGRFFTDRAQSDERRVKAAQYLLRVAAGEQAGSHVELSKHCLRCSKELTHPDSIRTNFGPECIKHVAPWLENLSGTDAGAHLPKAKVDEPNEIVGELSDDELDRAMIKCGERAERDPSEGNKRRLLQLAGERTRRNRERDNAQLPIDAGFVPPKPDLSRAGKVDNDPKPEIDADETFVARLRAGDDPKAVLAALDAA